MLRKLILCPFFGDMPPWMDKFIENYEATLKPNGYDLLIDTDIERFKERVKKATLIEYPGIHGTGKVWDYRCTLGLLYKEELEGFDYWAHCDFDVVFGDMAHFLPDSELSRIDVYSSHDTYVCGAFSLYKNVTAVNYLFMRQEGWREFLNKTDPNAWVEKEYSRVLESSGLRYAYDFSIQGNPYTESPILRKDNKRLYQNIDGVWKEIGMFHFRRSKHKGYPL